MRPLIVLYGLPGSGKSSLARALAGSGFCWANTVGHPEYGKSSMLHIVCNVLDKMPEDQGLVFEGVLNKRGWRTGFIRQVLRHAVKCGRRFDKVAVFQVKEPIEVLARRRNRSAADYEALREDLETGSPPFPHYEIDGQRLQTIAMRIEFINSCMRHTAPISHYASVRSTSGFKS